MTGVVPSVEQPVRRQPSAGKRRHCALLLALLLGSVIGSPAMPREDLTVDELKVRIANADVPHRPQLCLQVAEKQLAETDRLYAATENERAQTALTDVVAFSELARDYSIQSHKNQKQTEIAVRIMTRKLNSLLHTLAHDDQGAVREALHRLDRVRDDLLMSMFPKGSK